MRRSGEAGEEVQVTTRLALAAVQTGPRYSLGDVIGPPLGGRALRRGLHLYRSLVIGIIGTLSHRKQSMVRITKVVDPLDKLVITHLDRVDNPGKGGEIDLTLYTCRFGPARIYFMVVLCLEPILTVHLVGSQPIVFWFSRIIPCIIDVSPRAGYTPQ